MLIFMPLAKNVRMLFSANPQEISRSFNDIKSFIVTKSAMFRLQPPNNITALRKQNIM